MYRARKERALARLHAARRLPVAVIRLRDRVPPLLPDAHLARRVVGILITHLVELEVARLVILPTCLPVVHIGGRERVQFVSPEVARAPRHMAEAVVLIGLV